MKLVVASSLVTLMMLAACATKSTNTSAQTATPAASPSPSPSPSPTPSIPGKNIGYQFSCVREKDERKVEVYALAPKGCEVMYTKDGKTDKIASSSVGMEHCKATADKIRKNLETATYKCK